MDDRTQDQETGQRVGTETHNALTNARDNITTADLARTAENARAGTEAVSKNSSSGNGSTPADGTPPLLTSEQSSGLRGAWDNIQAGFVDEPRKSVADADHLVADAIRRLAESFAAERARLEQQWDRGEDVSTEDLRLALQRYRAFFQRLLAV